MTLLKAVRQPLLGRRHLSAGLIGVPLRSRRAKPRPQSIDAGYGSAYRDYSTSGSGVRHSGLRALLN